MGRPSKFNGKTVAVRIPKRALPLVMLLCEAIDAYEEHGKWARLERRWLKYIYYAICLFASKQGILYKNPIDVAWVSAYQTSDFDSVYRVVGGLGDTQERQPTAPWTLPVRAPIGVIWVNPTQTPQFSLPQDPDEFCTKLMEGQADRSDSSEPHTLADEPQHLSSGDKSECEPEPSDPSAGPRG